MSDPEDVSDGWAHTLATLREINERLPFKAVTVVTADGAQTLAELFDSGIYAEPEPHFVSKYADDRRLEELQATVRTLSVDKA